MKSLPANVVIEKNKLHTKSAWLVLLEITLNDDGGTVLRYVRNHADVIYNSNTYSKFNFDLEQSGDQSQGEIPHWKLKVSNVTRLLEPYLEELDGAIGSVVKIIVVNSELLSENYAELEKTFDVLACEADAQWVIFTLGAPSLLRQRYPLRRFVALHCGWHFSWAGGECSYSPLSVADISLAGSEPVVVQVNDHSFDDLAAIRLADINGISPSLAGTYSASYIDANRFDLIGTDSSSYSGSYSGGGTAGWDSCKRTLAECRKRLNSARFGGCPGLRSGGFKIV